MTLSELRELALERLCESGEHEEQWDFLFRTPGASEILYVPHGVVDGWEFDPEEWGWFGIAEARCVLISKGESPSNEELRRWKLAKAEDVMTRILSECCHAYIVPIYDGVDIEGYALFDAGLMDGDPDEEPSLLDVFKSEVDALKAAKKFGIVKELHEGGS